MPLVTRYYFYLFCIWDRYYYSAYSYLYEFLFSLGMVLLRGDVVNLVSFKGWVS